MDVIIVGAGPTGLTLGAALARRRHRVLAIDRDPGPAPNGTWRRRGVMQFEQAHGFRPQVRDLLLSEWPQAWQTWRDLGAEAVDISSHGAPTAGVRSRRITYERALRWAADDTAGLTVVTGHVRGLVERGGRVVGVVSDESMWHADLVIDAGGRLSRLAPPPETADIAGMAYIARSFRRLPGAAPGPMSSPFAWYGRLHGYDCYVFPHEQGHISVVIIRPYADSDMRVLHDVDAFDAACRAIPGLAEWIDPRVAVPTGGVKVGGGLLNTYRRQLGRPGLVAVGDTVATTAPTAGRGLAMASMQIAALLELLDTGADPVAIAEPFEAWCHMWIRPWVQDHLAFDAETVRRWQGEDIDLRRPLTSAAIVAAAQADSRLVPRITGFLAMTALPASLAAAEPPARAVYATGWRPPLADGPTRDELLTLADAVRDRSQSRHPTVAPSGALLTCE